MRIDSIWMWKRCNCEIIILVKEQMTSRKFAISSSSSDFLNMKMSSKSQNNTNFDNKKNRVNITSINELLGHNFQDFLAYWSELLHAHQIYLVPFQKLLLQLYKVPEKTIFENTLNDSLLWRKQTPFHYQQYEFYLSWTVLVLVFSLSLFFLSQKDKQSEKKSQR